MYDRRALHIPSLVYNGVVVIGVLGNGGSAETCGSPTKTLEDTGIVLVAGLVDKGGIMKCCTAERSLVDIRVVAVAILAEIGFIAGSSGNRTAVCPLEVYP